MNRKRSSTLLSYSLHIPPLASSYFLDRFAIEKSYGFFLGENLYAVQERILVHVLYILLAKAAH
jgi:hypothetical protein